jgi:hypothetical protein
VTSKNIYDESLEAIKQALDSKSDDELESEYLDIHKNNPLNEAHKTFKVKRIITLDVYAENQEEANKISEDWRVGYIRVGNMTCSEKSELYLSNEIEREINK